MSNGLNNKCQYVFCEDVVMSFRTAQDPDFRSKCILISFHLSKAKRTVQDPVSR